MDCHSPSQPVPLTHYIALQNAPSSSINNSLQSLTFTSSQNLRTSFRKNDYTFHDSLPAIGYSASNFAFSVPRTTDSGYVLSNEVQALLAKPAAGIINSASSEQSNSNQTLKDYIANIINKSYEGDFQIRAYRKEFLSVPTEETETEDGERFFSFAVVSTLIIGHEIKRTGSYEISIERIIELGKAAASFFECDTSEFILLPANGRGYGGALFESFRKLKSRELKFQGRTPTKGHGIKRKSIQEEQSENFNKLCDHVGIVDDEFMVLWSRTAQERQQFYAVNKLQIIFQKFSFLSSLSGVRLIEADSLLLYPLKSQEYSENLSSEIIEKIFKEARGVVKKLEKEGAEKNDRRKNILSQILASNTSFANAEHRLTTAFMILPYLYNKINKVPPNRKHVKAWHPEQYEAQKSFVYYLKEVQNLDQELSIAFNEINSLHKDHFVEIGPHIIIVGPTLDNISATYLCIDDKVRYETKSCSTAVGLCIDFVKVFHKKYSAISSHVWESIEIVFCNIKNEHPSKTVNSLIKKLRRKSKN